MRMEASGRLGEGQRRRLRRPSPGPFWWRRPSFLGLPLLAAMVLNYHWMISDLPETLSWDTTTTTAATTTTTTTTAVETTQGSTHLQSFAPVSHPPECCYQTQVDLVQLLTPEYFDQQSKISTRPYKGSEFVEWKDFVHNTTLGQALVSPTPSLAKAAGETLCSLEWKRVVLEASEGFYLQTYLDALAGRGNDDYPYVPYHHPADHNPTQNPKTPPRPRILLLGDSISIGITVETQNMFGDYATLQGSPANGQGIDAFARRLDHWLGACPWDLIQFNVGQHFHPDPASPTPQAGLLPYEESLRTTLRKLRHHSPKAVLVVAATTPSPLDMEATQPNPDTCPHYHKFHPKGFVPSLNQVAQTIASEEGALFNDRFASVAPRLLEYQMPCDIHFSLEGYRALAQSDWSFFVQALDHLNPPPISACCFHTSTTDDLGAKFTPDYLSRHQWNGTKDSYSLWQQFWKETKHGRALAQVAPGVPNECELQWKNLVLDQTEGYFWNQYLVGLQEDLPSGATTAYPNPIDFPYVTSRPGIPRILLLGDSISQGIWKEVIHYFSAHANIHTAPTDCKGLEEYQKHLDTWLGDCPYHMIHFNIGWHYGPEQGTEAYAKGLRTIVARLRKHSPIAQIVFATTTPSPLDAPEGSSSSSSCEQVPPHSLASLAPFPPPGWVDELNQVAKSVAKELSVVINDRHKSVLSRRTELQKPCDVHFTLEGNQFLATSDWTTIGGYLGLLPS